MPILDKNLFIIESIVHHRAHDRIDDLVTLLEERPHDWIVYAAAWAIERLEARSALPALRVAGHRSSGCGSHRAVQTLMKLGSDELRASIVEKLLHSPNSLHSALGGYHTRHPDLVPLVEPYCDSPRAPVREQARRFVAKHAEPPPSVVEYRLDTAQIHERLGDAGYEKELYGLCNLMGDRAASIQIFVQFLEHGAIGFDTAELEQLAALPDEILSVWRYCDHDFGVLEGITTASTSRLKDLVRPELERRRTTGRRSP